MKKENMSYDTVDMPPVIDDMTVDELATLKQLGILDISEISEDLVDAVIDYQFNL